MVLGAGVTVFCLVCCVKRFNLKRARAMAELRIFRYKGKGRGKRKPGRLAATEFIPRNSDVLRMLQANMMADVHMDNLLKEEAKEKEAEHARKECKRKRNAKQGKNDDLGPVVSTPVESCSSASASGSICARKRWTIRARNQPGTEEPGTIGLLAFGWLPYSKTFIFIPNQVRFVSMRRSKSCPLDDRCVRF